MANKKLIITSSSLFFDTIVDESQIVQYIEDCIDNGYFQSDSGDIIIPYNQCSVIVREEDYEYADRTQVGNFGSTDIDIDLDLGSLAPSNPGGGGPVDLGDLTDVTLTDPVNDQALVYSNGKWINKTLATVALTGSYNDLSDQPVIPTVPTDISELTDNTNLLFDGDYGSLSNTPTIPTDISNLTDNTNLLFDGDYGSLSNTPTIPADISELTDTQGLLQQGGGATVDDTAGVGDTAVVWSADKSAKRTIAVDNTNLTSTDDGKIITVSASSDPIDAYTKLLLHLDVSPIVDAAQGLAIGGNINGGSISSTHSKFGGYSLYYGGGNNGPALTVTDASLNTGSSDFTLDFWMRLSSNNGYSDYVTFLSGDESFILGMINGNPFVYSYAAPSGTKINSGNIYTENEWVHVAFVRNAGTIYVYKNGVQVASASWGSNLDANGNLYSIGWGGVYSWTGYIDEMRWSPGIARWTTAFTPPTSAYGVDPTYVVSSNKVNNDGASSNDIWAADKVIAQLALKKETYTPKFNYAPIDQFNYNLVEYWPMTETSGTRFGLKNAIGLIDTNTVTNTTGKSGNGALFTRANQEYFICGAPKKLATTIFASCWIYPSNSGTNRGIIGAKTTATYSPIWLFVTSGNIIEIATGGNNGENLHYVDGTTTILNDNWYHVAVWINGADKVYLYVNGSSEGTPAAITPSLGPMTELYIGAYYDGGISSSTFGGCIDEVGLWLDLPFTNTEAAALASAIYNSGTGRFMS